jgi:Glycosyl hydrolase family 65 central catalytic domain
MPPPKVDPRDYYHCFMGNGLDAVLVGYTGAMVAERAQGNLDRCYWYKADRYYPESRVAIIPGRLPREGQPLHMEGAPWREIAPLARTWYEIRYGGLRLDVRTTEQRFVPAEGILYSNVDYGAANAEVTTFLHALRSVLVVRCRFDKPVSFRAYGAAGVWVEEGYDADPFDEVRYNAGGSSAEYRLGDTKGLIMLGITPEPSAHGSGDCIWQEVEAQEVTQYFAVVDDQDGPLDVHALDDARALGYEALHREHVDAWHEYAATSQIAIPDERFQRCYDYSLYQFRAAQNRLSGGLPVNNLRLTWSSHVFWDAYFMHRVLLEAGRLDEALEAVRFFMRTVEQARKHAQEDFGAPGLKWDWEVTHKGERAYGTWLHQKEQVHNNASYANMIWGYYEFTRDRDYLAEFYPLLHGMAEFFLANVIERTERGYEVRPLVDVGEHVTRVRNEGMNLTGAIRILQLTAQAAQELQKDDDFASQCAETAAGLMKTLDLLYNGKYFQSAEDVDTLTLSSLAPIYPMTVIPPTDPRAISTAQVYRQKEGNGILSAWSAGILSTIYAMEGGGDIAWGLLTDVASAMCNFGGMAEHVYRDGHWNMQYFGTAQAAVCTAIHHLLLQGRAGEITLFPAIPSGWSACSFERLLVNGVEVSGRFDREAKLAQATLYNAAAEPLQTSVRYGKQAEDTLLSPGESKSFDWEIT